MYQRLYFLDINILNNMSWDDIKKINGVIKDLYQYQGGKIERLIKKTSISYWACYSRELAIPNFRGQDHVKVMNSSTPLRANSDASPSPLHSPIYQQDEAIPSTSRGRNVSSIITHTFDSLALDVSYAGLGVSGSDLVDSGSTRTTLNTSLRENASNLPQFWEDIGVVEYLERRLGPPDESTPEERVATLREVLAERTDIHEGDGNLSDFLFHVARTKHGKIYIRVIRTLLLNRGKY